MPVTLCLGCVLLATSAPPVESDAPLIDARAVLWPHHSSFSGDRMCDVLIKNLSDDIITLPRFPTAYNERLVQRNGIAEVGWLHCDSGIADLVELEPGRTFVYEFVLHRVSEAASKSALVELMFGIDVSDGGPPRDYEIRCRIDPKAVDHGITIKDTTDKRRKQGSEIAPSDGKPSTTGSGDQK